MPKSKLPFKEFKWTPRLAYAVGLIVTDGNLSNDGRHINLRSTDLEMIESFKRCLSLKNKTGLNYAQFKKDCRAGKPCYRVQFGNVQLFRWLVSIGITPAKSRIIGKVKIPDRLFRDFLRGHLDGDGCIRIYVDRYNTYRGRTYENQRVFTRFISASPRHLAWLTLKIRDLAGVTGAFFEDKTPTENRAGMWVLQFARKESLRLFEWIYYRAGLPCLSRKRLLAEQAVRIAQNEKRKAYARVTAQASSIA